MKTDLTVTGTDLTVTGTPACRYSGIGKPIASSATPWLYCPRPNPEARLRLFCFPYAVGTANVFRPWADSFPAEIELYAIQLPGRGPRLTEPAFDTLAPLVQALGRSLHRYFEEPFAFFGHSMGALVSFELARYLRREWGLEPAHLFFSGRRAPQLAEKEPPVHLLSHAQLLEKMRSLNGTPPEVLNNREFVELMLPIFRADFSVCETYAYIPELPFQCPISVFGGLEDEDVDRLGLEAWGVQTTSRFSLHMLAGDHFFLHTCRRQLLEMLWHKLSETLGEEALYSYV